MALLPKNQRDQVMVLLVIVAVALVGLYYAYVYSPKSDVLTDLQTHVDSLDVSNQRAKAELAKGNVEELRAEAAKFQANLDVMRQLVPPATRCPPCSSRSRRPRVVSGSISRRSSRSR